MNVVVGPRRHKAKDSNQRTLMSYVIGYIISVYLTVTAFILVHEQLSSRMILLFIIVTLALVQFMVQLLFFLHLGKETRPRWKLLVLFFMIIVVCILVFGSLWIMESLNNHMSINQMENYMQNESEDL